MTKKYLKLFSSGTVDDEYFGRERKLFFVLKSDFLELSNDLGFGSVVETSH
jgi:hypothetical protein